MSNLVMTKHKRKKVIELGILREKEREIESVSKIYNF